MNQTLVFSNRNFKEIIREPINVIFSLGFPIVVMLLLTFIQKNIPTPVFELNQITPGMAVFGLSFIALFSGTLIAKDRSSSFLVRLFTSPMKPSDFIMGYILPILPMAMIQISICFLVAILLGLSVSVNILLAIVVTIPTALLYVGLGLLTGTAFNDKQVGGICGALLTNLTAWLSGAWIDLNLVGGAFKSVAYLLPFAHANDAGKAALAGDLSAALPHILWVSAYTVVIMAAAILLFRHKMISDQG